MTFNRTTTTPGGYTQNPTGQRPIYDKTYFGFVKDIVDAERMGRLKVYIPDLGGDPTDPSKWHVVNYCSPFAGATKVDQNVKNGKNEGDAQQSYGMWFVPPDLENQVVVMFINGDPAKGIWLGCMYQQKMNHMVPGVASGKSFPTKEGGSNPIVPVTEYNKKDSSVAVNDPVRPAFQPLTRGLTSQGLFTDPERGTTNASARRGDAANVYGFNTPKQHQFYCDEENGGLFRIRTKGGTQVVVHDEGGYVYINSKNGNSWIEISDDGIDLYTSQSISMRSEQDFNIRADRDLNIDVGGNMNVRVQGNRRSLINGSEDVSIGLDNRISVGANLHTSVGNQFNQSIGGKLSINANGKIAIAGSSTFDVTSGGDQKYFAPNIYDNTTQGEQPTQADSALKIALFNQKTRELVEPNFPLYTMDTTVTRMPYHEPWDFHPATGKASASSGTRFDNKRTLVEGETADKVSVDKDGNATIETGNYGNNPVKINEKVKKQVIDCVKAACDATGMDFGGMMGILFKENGRFDPNASGPGGYARGLYQFINSTWNGLVKSYGADFGLKSDGIFDTCQNAMGGALYARDNKAYLKKTLGREPSYTEIYLAHFLGPAGAAKFIGIRSTNPNLKMDEAFKQIYNNSSTANQAIRNNRGVVFDSSGKERSVQGVYAYFENIVEGSGREYASLFANPTA